MSSSARFSNLELADQRYIESICRNHSIVLREESSPSWESQIEKLSPELKSVALLEIVKVDIYHYAERNDRLLPTPYYLRIKYPQSKETLDWIYPQLPAKFRVPDVITKYQITKMLKNGGQARVFFATEKGETTKVVLKIARNSSHDYLLNVEAQFLKQLTHPHIAELLDHGAHEGRTFLALKAYDGDNLKDYAGENTPDSLYSANILLEVAKTVENLHRHKIAHRDIKPENVHRDIDGVIRLLDLGMAISFDEGGLPRKPLLQHGGTPAYMAPEQIVEQKDSDPRLSDLYSLGATLYYLLTNEHPKPPVCDANGNWTVSSDRQRPARCPSRLWKICQTAMQPEPEQRQGSVAEFISQLEQFVRDQEELERTRDRRKRRLSIAKVAIPLAMIPVALLVMIIVNGNPISQTTSGAFQGSVTRDSWYRRVAEEQGIDLDELTADDFDVRVVVEEKPIIKQHFPAKLIVSVDNRLGDLIGALEFRIGKRPWKHMLTDLQGNTYGQLDNKDLSSNGQLEMQLDSIIGYENGDVVGPFQFDIDLATEIERSRKRQIQATISAAAASEWLESETGPLRLSSKISTLYHSVIREMRLGKSSDQLTHRVSIRRKLTGDSRDDFIRRDFPEMHRTFGAAMQDLRNTQIIYAQLVFVDGTTSRVRPFQRKNINERKEGQPRGFGGGSF